jgi:hypothetical protein
MSNLQANQVYSWQVQEQILAWDGSEFLVHLKEEPVLFETKCRDGYKI